MIQKPIDVLDKFPVRKTKAQKTGFIDAIRAYAQEQGYGSCVECPKKGVRNIVIGDQARAKYLITAHYDTPASIGLPNFIVPNNPALFIEIQLALVAVLVAAAVVVGLVAYLLCADERTAFLAGYLAYLAIFLLMLKGPAKRSNANDNTSGIVTVLEILSVIPQELRSSVCFVLFDMEEGGLIGSAAYRKSHKDMTEKQIVLNLDCVGDGDVIQLAPVKKARNDSVLLESLSKLCVKTGDKEIRLRSKGFYGGSSDHKNFPFGIAIMAFRYKKGVGLYCGRIHTWRDKILDVSNISILRDSLITFIADHSNKMSEIVK